MSIQSVLLDGAAAFKSSATHLGRAESSAIKAVKATAEGKGSIAALHRANAQRAFTASVRDAGAGQATLSNGRGIDWTRPGEQLLRDMDTAVASLRSADSLVYRRGAGALVETTSWFNGKPTHFASTSNARKELLKVAGDAHGLAVLPPR